MKKIICFIGVAVLCMAVLSCQTVEAVSVISSSITSVVWQGGPAHISVTTDVPLADIYIGIWIDDIGDRINLGWINALGGTNVGGTQWEVDITIPSSTLLVGHATYLEVMWLMAADYSVNTRVYDYSAFTVAIAGDEALLAACIAGRELVTAAPGWNQPRNPGKGNGQGVLLNMPLIAQVASEYVDSLEICNEEDADELHSCIVSYFASGGKSSHFGE